MIRGADQLNIIVGDGESIATSRIKEVCEAIPGINGVGVAHSQKMLIAKINHKKPDLILLSLNDAMGGIDLINTIKNIDQRLVVIVLYNQYDHNSDALINALELGVYECIEKPGDKDSRQYKEFRLRLLTLTGLLVSRKQFSKRTAHHKGSKFFMRAKMEEKKCQPVSARDKVDVVAIASSTGGPEILSRIFSILPGNLNVPILLVQHIPAKISQYFAKSLDKKSELKIFQASHGDILSQSKVYLAPGGKDMTISKPNAKGQRTIILHESHSVNGARPSADLLFASIAESYPGNVLAIVLTGMGVDGTKGVAALKEKGCFCITQNPETCVVYGMPRAVDEAGFSDESLDPLSITQKIVIMTAQ